MITELENTLELELENHKYARDFWVDDLNDDFVSIQTFSYVTITDVQCEKIKNLVEKILNKNGVILHTIFVGPYFWEVKNEA